MTRRKFMSITFHIPAYLSAFANGQKSVKIGSGTSTAKEALDALWSVYPGLRDRILDEQGEVRQHINVFVGGESIRFAAGLATPVPDGSEILIVPAVSGG